MPRIFISYRRRDTGGYAGRLYDRLAMRFGDDSVFMDTGNIPVGQNFEEVIGQFISTCDVFLAVIGPDWWEKAAGSPRIQSQEDPVRIEILRALEHHKRVIPVLVANANVPIREKLPTDIQPFVERQAARLTQERFREDVDRLADTLGDPSVKPGRPVPEPAAAGVRYDSTIKDLLRVRDAFHAHLLRKQNVIGTAIGRFLVRKTDPWPTVGDGVQQPMKWSREPRTLENSEVRPYSLPCVLVFVSRWSTEFPDPAQAIEHVLEMPDGGRVPTCVVLVPTAQNKGQDAPVLPQGPVGGGYLVTSDHQGVTRAATLGCPVKDEAALYALTSLQAIGHDERPVTAFSVRRYLRGPVGATCERPARCRVDPFG